MLKWSHMTDTAHRKDRLDAERLKLEDELKTVGRRNPSNPSDWEAVPSVVGQESDPNDAADLITNYEDNTAILKELEARYNDVVGALARMEDGSYGVCRVCGKEIESDRLEADPAAPTCKEHLNG
jgi:RNA polymerase-binding transcription factor DksA